eukprot:scpid98884/ scgid9107/ 
MFHAYLVCGWSRIQGSACDKVCMVLPISLLFGQKLPIFLASSAKGYPCGPASLHQELSPSTLMSRMIVVSLQMHRIVDIPLEIFSRSVQTQIVNPMTNEGSSVDPCNSTDFLRQDLTNQPTNPVSAAPKQSTNVFVLFLTVLAVAIFELW